MDIFATYATDAKLENEGVWVNLSKTARVRVARSGNEAYQAALRDGLAAHQLEIDAGGSAADEVAERVIIDVMARTILVGWEGLTFKGAAAPYSVEMARTMLGVKDFRKKVNEIAGSFEAYRVKTEAAQGNG